MKRSNFSYISKDNRPWGEYFVIHDEKNYKIKRIEVNPSSRLSYQYHNGRAETWVIIKGKARVIIDGSSELYRAGDTILIPRKSKHRIENITDEILVFIEIQTGDYFNEDDIIRVEDDYNRLL